jgi:hypothetical protein
LIKQSTFFNNFKYKSNITLHYTAHASCITGRYERDVPLLKPLSYPSVFELFRKHSVFGRDPLSAWWISNHGGPFPFLYSSSYTGYGSMYAGTMIQPYNLFKTSVSFELPSISGNSYLKLQSTDFNDEHNSIQHKTSIIDNNQRTINFFNQFQQKFSKIEGNIWGLGSRVNKDIYNAFFASEVISYFNPKLTVFNMQEVDIGHSNYTSYCNNLHKIDFAAYKIWETIQNDRVMKDNTVMIITPEFGRNKDGNTLVDQFGRKAIDHTGDEISQNIFCMVLGPEALIKHNNKVTEQRELIDIVPTIADLLGFENEIPKGLLHGKILNEIYA